MPIMSADTRVVCARRHSRRIRLGTVDIGDGAPISIQS
jgi:4-hydroxy-3-methylbut-2-en-1-yl diphosphate synthase IspG/GcpE